MKAEREIKIEWTNWTFGGWWVSRRKRRGSKLIAGIEIGPLLILWTDPLLYKQLHPRVREGRTLVTRSDRGGHPPTP